MLFLCTNLGICFLMGKYFILNFNNYFPKLNYIIEFFGLTSFDANSFLNNRLWI